jgi:putative oxidoreductase
MYADAAPLEVAGRLIIVTYFVLAGLCNLNRERVRDHVSRMAQFGTPWPAFVHWTGITLQFLACALLLTDWYPEVGAGILIAFTIAATLIFHRFWNMQDPPRRNISRVMMLNNAGVLGGLVLLLHSVWR